MLFLSLVLWLSMDPKDLIETPIPEEVWQIKEDTERGINDAVILQDLTKFTLTRTERFMRIRILNEKGKEAAEIIDPTGSLKLVGGKVTDASGKVTQFDKNEDLVEILSSQRGRRKNYKRILVPPAMTNNCVVDIAWYEASDEGIPRDEYIERYEVQRLYFAKEVQYVIDPTALRDSGNYHVSRFSWYNGLAKDNFTQSEKGKATILVWKDVPAREYQPYGNLAYDKQQAYVISYRTPPNMVNDPNRFWRDFSQQFYEPRFDVKFRGAGDHSEWLSTLKAKLPEDKIEALNLVAQEFRNRYHPSDLLPPEKRTRYTEHDTKAKDKVVFREITKHGFADAYLITRLFYTVLRDLDIEPKMVLANSFYSHPFIPAEMNIYSLNTWYPSFGYQREDGSWFLVNPGYAEYEPGETPPEFQGTNALIINPADRWSISFGAIPRLPSGSHRVIRQYTAELDEKHTLKQSMEAVVTGEFRAKLRRKYFSLMDEDKAASLKADWENYLAAGAKVTESSFQNMDHLGPELSYKLSWEIDHDKEESGPWFRYLPFTGSYVPLSNDDIWNKNRTQPIVIPHSFDNFDKATLTVPEGYTLRGNPTWKKQNGVGMVAFQAVQKGNTIVVARHIVLAVDVIGQEHANQVREFLAWVDEAEVQRIAIVRSQS